MSGTPHPRAGLPWLPARSQEAESYATGDVRRWYGAADDPGATIETYRGLIAHVERHLGAGHVSILTALDKFAMWQGRTGSPDEAVRVLIRMLSIALQILDSDDPTIPIITGNIAFWRAQGQRPRGVSEERP